MGCTDFEAKNWRDLVSSKLPNTIDPMRRDYRGREQELYREVVELDKRDILQADVILVNYSAPSVGTSMEILWAWINRIPVVLVTKPENRLSPWLLYHCTKICHSFEEAINWIQEVVL